MSAERQNSSGNDGNDRARNVAGADGAHAIASVVFVDIVSSMSEIELLDPEDARDALDEALQPIVARIRQLGGTVARIQGDGVMAVFGAPAATEDHALRACVAAHLICKDMRAIGRRAVRIGVHSCRILTRVQENDFGSVYDVVGAGVHRAKHLEERAPPNTALISDETLDLARPFVTVRTLQCGADALHQIESVALDHDLTQQFSRDHIAPLVGRDEELHRLFEVLQGRRTATAPVKTFALIGEAGLGKSRLLFELTKAARANGIRVEELRGVALQVHAPFAPLKSLARRLLGIEDRAELHSIVAAVESLGRDSSNVLLELLDLPPLDRDWSKRDGATRRRIMLSTGRALFERAMQQRRCLLVVEDLHNLDAETLSFLALLRQTKSDLAIVMTSRNEGRASAATLADKIIDLTPLSEVDARALALDLTRDHPLDKDDVDRALERAAGNPLFLQALIRDTHRGKSGRAPQTIATILQSRMTRLSLGARTLLHTAAVLGDGIDVQTLARTVGLPHNVLPALLAELDAHDLMNAEEGVGIRFRHDLFRAAAYDLLLRSERAILHRSAVKVYESAEPTAEHIDRLAHHAAMAGDVSLALTSILAGTKLAQRTSSYATIRRYYDWANELRRDAKPDATPTLVAIAMSSIDALQQLGDGESYETALEFIIEHAAESGDRAAEAHARAHLALLLWMRAKHAEGRFHAEAALKIAKDLGSLPLRALAQPHLANIEHALGNIDRAIALHLEIIDALEAAGEQSTMGRMIVPIVRSRAFAAWFLAERGDFAESERQIAKGEAELAIAEQPYSRVLINAAKGVLGLRSGRPHDAIPPLTASREFCLANRVYVMEPCLTGWLASALVGVGMCENARSIAKKSIDEGLYRHGGRYTWVYVFQALAEAELACGDSEKALEAIEKALEIASESAEPIQISSVLYVRGNIKKSTDAAAARADFAKALEICRRHNLSPLAELCLRAI